MQDHRQLEFVAWLGLDLSTSSGRKDL